jgi:diacylglycerol kinase (ATP)
LARRPNLLQSFNWAFDGIVHALHRERNMWIHFGAAVVVLLAALFFSLARLEVIALFVAISFVLITEMLNTSIEHVVDLVTDELDPRAKIAKDVAAGAVLVATINAVAVAYLVFYDKLTGVPYTVLRKLRTSPVDLAVVTLVLVILAAVIIKALTHKGTAFHGGMPSVHAAVAFACWVAVTVFGTQTAYALPISAIGLFMAVMVAQSRVQAGIHSTLEVVIGALLGTGVSLLIFQLWYPI